MVWTERESTKKLQDFKKRFQDIYRMVAHNGEKWFEYKEGKFFELELLSSQKDDPFFVIADGHLSKDGNMVSLDDSDGFFISDYEDDESLFQALVTEVERWKTLEDDD